MYFALCSIRVLLPIYSLQADELLAERQRSIQSHRRQLIFALVFAVPIFLIAMILPRFSGGKGVVVGGWGMFDAFDNALCWN